MLLSNPWRHKCDPLEDEIRWAPHFGAAWHKEVALFEFLQPRAKIKTKQTGM